MPLKCDFMEKNGLMAHSVNTIGNNITSGINQWGNTVTNPLIELNILICNDSTTLFPGDKCD